MLRNAVAPEEPLISCAIKMSGFIDRPLKALKMAVWKAVFLAVVSEPPKLVTFQVATRS